MRIALLGFGKMGKLIAGIAEEKGHSIAAKFTSKDPVTKEKIAHADVCIDFSHPDVVIKNIKLCAQAKKPIVVGTTGWYDHLHEVADIVKANHIGLFYAPNFSIGVNLFLQVVEEASKLMNRFHEYDVGTVESHHNRKADAPSGTAIAIAEKIIKNMQRKKRIDCNPDGRIDEECLHVSSLRCGFIPGSHSVLFDSHVDTITLTHQARNREGFAHGAIAAAEWLKEKKGILTMQDMVKEEK